MPLTKTEQKVFEDMFQDVAKVHPDSKFLELLAELIFEMTGNVNLRMRLFRMQHKALCRKE